MSTFRLIHADVMDGLRSLTDASVDAIVCDPPYGIRFMGKAWDGADIERGVALRRSQAPMPDDGKAGVNGGYQSPAAEAGRYNQSLTANQAFQVWCCEWSTECLRVLKPGGHLLAFGGSRTYHRLACAVEDAGFEIRDQLQWLYGSGFPKSLDVSKAIDRRLGATPRVVGTKKVVAGVAFEQSTPYSAGKTEIPITEGATAAAAALQGWGTALKPACEPIVFARKPLIGTVAANVLRFGTGALNINACRIETDEQWVGGGATKPRETGIGFASSSSSHPDGRWPANVLLDEEAAAILDEQSGRLTSGRSPVSGFIRNSDKHRNTFAPFTGNREEPTALYGDTGGASRFFYVAKADSGERNDGLEDFTTTTSDGRAKPADNAYQRGKTERHNHHPTVKPIAVMRWLVRLVTPKGGVVLDPFVGSGTTGCAAVSEGFDFIGIDREGDYLDIARARIQNIAPLLASEVPA